MLSEAEFEAILADPTKRIIVDIVWLDDPGHPPARLFRAPVESDQGWPLTAMGWWQPWPGKLSYGLLHPDADARIIGLDLGYPQHRNPTREFIYGTHKHRWTDAYGGDWAYVPTDITVNRDQPLELRRQFCTETGTVHTASGITRRRRRAAVTPDELCEALSSQLPSLFEYRPGLRGDVQVITPLIYPDGGLVDVFVMKRGRQYVVTDYGDAHGWLRMQSWTGKLTPHQEELIARACRSLGVDLDHGRLSLCCEDAAELAQTTLLVAQAALRVANVRPALHADKPPNNGNPPPANKPHSQTAPEPGAPPGARRALP